MHADEPLAAIQSMGQKLFPLRAFNLPEIRNTLGLQVATVVQGEKEQSGISVGEFDGSELNKHVPEQLSNYIRVGSIDP